MRQIPLRLWAMAVLSGILLVLPFPIAGPTPLWRTAFCWVALVPLFAALLGKDKIGNPLAARQGAALGYICGFVWYLGNYHALFGTLLAVFRTHFGRQAALLLSPFAWVAVELARARITGLPWDLL